MKPILFLDIDGVLNSQTFQRAFNERLDVAKPPGWHNMSARERDVLRCFDPAAMQRLNRVVAETGCLVVLSSSWRKAEPLTVITWIMRQAGFKHRLFAATPALYYGDGVFEGRHDRGSEIQYWLNMLGFVQHDDYAVFAIVDDDSDMRELEGRLVQTDNEVGLTDEDAARLIALLKDKV